jgi:hypothetical protein
LQFLGNACYSLLLALLVLQGVGDGRLPSAEAASGVYAHASSLGQQWAHSQDRAGFVPRDLLRVTVSYSAPWLARLQSSLRAGPTAWRATGVVLGLEEPGLGTPRVRAIHRAHLGLAHRLLAVHAGHLSLHTSQAPPFPS